VANFKITNETKSRHPRLPFLKMKESVLTKSYDLSLVFAKSGTAKKLNKNYRKKTYVPNVLAFPIDTKSGEIFINLEVAHKQSAIYGYTQTQFVGYLFIHALFHLKGLDHGKKMESAESKIQKKFNIRKIHSAN
jgi:probable rRNA maturation factor